MKKKRKDTGGKEWVGKGGGGIKGKKDEEEETKEEEEEEEEALSKDKKEGVASKAEVGVVCSFGRRF